MGKLAVLIDAELHNELVLRTRSRGDVTGFIEHAIQTFLDRTESDGDLWSDAYLAGLLSDDDAERAAEYGDPSKGYVWQTLRLPNGTQLKMTYRHRDHFAEIRHEMISYQGEKFSPSQWAHRVANNTSRNAWRDIWIKRPGETAWQLAESVRRAEMR